MGQPFGLPIQIFFDAHLTLVDCQWWEFLDKLAQRVF